MDLVQGYASCGRPLSEPATNLPLMKEDDDVGAGSESTLSIDKTGTSVGKEIDENWKKTKTV